MCGPCDGRAQWPTASRLLSSSRGRILRAGDCTAAGGAEPGPTQDSQPIIKLVTPENAAYLFAKFDIASPGPSAMGRIRWNMIRILFFCALFSTKGILSRAELRQSFSNQVYFIQKENNSSSSSSSSLTGNLFTVTAVYCKRYRICLCYPCYTRLDLHSRY